MAEAVLVPARLRRRNQSGGGGNDPAAAPAHDGLHASDVREWCRRARPSEFRQDLREPRCRPVHRQPSSRESSPAWFPAPPPRAAASRAQRKGQHLPGKHRACNRQQDRWLGNAADNGGRIRRGCRLSRAFNLAAWPSFGKLRRGRFFLRNGHKTELACKLGPIQAAGPSQSKACHDRRRDQHRSACPIAKGLTHHQYRVAIGPSGNSTGARVAATAGGPPRSPTRSQRYSARGFA